MQHKVPKHKSRAPLDFVEGKKNAETDKKINKVQIVGVWLTNTFPESKIGPPNLVIKQIRDRPEQQKRLMVVINQDFLVFFHQITQFLLILQSQDAIFGIFFFHSV